jgi:hypothetical protein
MTLRSRQKFPRLWRRIIVINFYDFFRLSSEENFRFQVRSNDSHNAYEIDIIRRQSTEDERTLPFIGNLSAAGRYEFFISIRDWNFLVSCVIFPEKRRNGESKQPKNEIDDRNLIKMDKKRKTFSSSVTCFPQCRIIVKEEKDFLFLPPLPNRIINEDAEGWSWAHREPFFLSSSTQRRSWLRWKSINGTGNASSLVSFFLGERSCGLLMAGHSVRKVLSQPFNTIIKTPSIYGSTRWRLSICQAQVKGL